MNPSPAPVLFIHGLWIHATAWQPWIEHFDAAGYSASAPGWPGDGDTVEASRANPDAIADHGIDEVTEHYRGIIRGLDTLPIVIGHSFGGLIAEKLLGEDLAAAARTSETERWSAVTPCTRLRCSSLSTKPRSLSMLVMPMSA
jgi:alpha-beta hydrolase superfamily lysophospholipase